MKSKFLFNIFLMLVWLALTGDFTLSNYLFGFIFSFFILWLISQKGKKSDGRRSTNYFVIAPKFLLFFFFFLYELVKANLQVAYEIMTPNFKMTPGIIKVPLDVKSDAGITLLSNLITLTPGTLALDISDNKEVLYVHSMYISDKETFIKSIKDGFEKRILELWA